MNTNLVMADSLWKIILFGGFIFFLILGKKRREENYKTKQTLGISWLQHLKELLSQTQQHRGLSSSYLNGNLNTLPDLIALEKKVSKSIVNIEKLGLWVPSNVQWQSITRHWARLSKSNTTGDFNNNLNQHNHLIQNLLYFIDDMAAAHNLLLLDEDKQKPFHFAWRELLPASEYIGQARALGVGVVTEKTCQSIERIRLNYLHRKISENTSRVWKTMPPEPDQRACVEKLLDCLKADVIQVSINIEPKDYFNIATQALDVLHQQYDKLVEEKRWQIR